MAEPFDPVDWRDLPAVVQRLRMIGFRAALGPAALRDVYVPWFEDLDGFAPYVEALEETAAMSGGERRAECLLLAEETRRVHAALASGLERPSVDDVIARFVGGEIGDRTARYVLGMDAFDLAEECVRRNLPPFQAL